MVVDLKYFNSLENEIKSLQSQLETQRTQFLNEIDRISREYYYVGHMNEILSAYTKLDEVTNLQCDYLEALEKCQSLENELSKRNTTSISFEALQQHAINLEIALQQYLKARLQDKNIAISALKKLIDKMKGKYVETKTKKPIVVPISTSRPKRTVNQSVATLHKKSVIQKPRSTFRKLYEHVSKTCSWWYPKITPPGYKWEPKSKLGNVNTNLVEIILFIIDSRCSKHMTGNLKLLVNFMEKFLGTVKFGNEQIAPILGYGDLVQGKVTIKMIYYVEGLNHNLFSLGQFCDVDLEVAFRKSTCYIRDLKGNDILTGSRASSSQAWLWHHRLSHLNFDTINFLSKYDIVTSLPKLKFVKDHLCSSCELGKAKRYSTQSRAYRVFNKRTRVLVKTIHVTFDELPQMASDQFSSDPVPQFETVTTSNELDFLFSSMFYELFNRSSSVVSKTSVVPTANARDKHQQQDTTPSTSTIVSTDSPPLNIPTTPAPTSQAPIQITSVTPTENINQAESQDENVQVKEDEFVNILSTPVPN
ncbi:integrase, catalytic region, zinc finger, CCHC-type containing protein [Tanacetum coccineum]